MIPTLPCAADPESWFSEDPGTLRVAAKLCADCPIRQTCLEDAMRAERDSADRYGVFGGLKPAERAALARYGLFGGQTPMQRARQFHGTPNGYRYHGCRDVCCRTAWSDYKRQQRRDAKAA